ncbi:MAG: TolC family protein [Campylobacterota bacterium]|nr:TolC family protein [Campylobacterota bacterium]
MRYLPFFMLLGMPLFALTLDEAVHTALEKNPNINLVRSDTLKQKQLLKQSQALRFGKLDALASYTHYNLPRTLKPLVPPIESSVPSTQNLCSVGVTYTVALFTGFEEQSDIEIAELSTVIANSTLSITSQQLVYNVKSLYLKILASQALLQAQLSYLKAVNELHKNIVLEVELEKKAKLDALKSAAAIEESKLQIIKIRSNLKILRASLSELMGVENLEELEQVSIEQVALNSSLNVYEKSIEGLERYRSVALNEKRAQKAQDKVRALYYPQVMFNSYYGQNFGAGFDENLWQAGVTANWTLFDFGKRSAQMQSAEIIQMQAKLHSSKMKFLMKKEFIQAVSNVESEQQNIKSNQAQVALLNETQRIEQVRYDNGAVELNDLLLAKAKYLLTQSRLIETEFRYQDALFYLEYLRESETL